jgi:hypothetical protein
MEAYMAKKADNASKDATLSTITILVDDIQDPTEGDQVRGLFRRKDEVRYARVQIPGETLRDNLRTFLSNMDSVMHQIPGLIGGYTVDTLTISVEVSAKGTVSLLGTGGEFAGKGGLTLTLKRR